MSSWPMARPTVALALGPAIVGEGIIPPRHAIPGRVKSHTLRVIDELFEKAPPNVALDLVIEKLRLEDERVRRMLPEIPAGYSWRGELQSHEEMSFERNHADVTMRIVYRLHGPDGERVE